MRSWFGSKLAARTGAASSSEAAAAQQPNSSAGGFGSVEDFSAPRSDPRVVPSESGPPRRPTAASMMSLERHFQESFRVGTGGTDGDNVDLLDDGNASVQTEDFLAVLANNNDDDRSQASSAPLFDESQYAADDDDDDETEDDNDDSRSLVSSNSAEWKAMHASKFLHDMMMGDDEDSNSIPTTAHTSSCDHRGESDADSCGSGDNADVDADPDARQHADVADDHNDREDPEEAEPAGELQGPLHASTSASENDDQDDDDHGSSHSRGDRFDGVVDDDRGGHAHDESGEGSYYEGGGSHGSRSRDDKHGDGPNDDDDGGDSQSGRDSRSFDAREDGGSNDPSEASSEGTPGVHGGDNAPSQRSSSDDAEDKGSYSSQHSDADSEKNRGGPPLHESFEQSDEGSNRSRTILEADEGGSGDDRGFESDPALDDESSRGSSAASRRRPSDPESPPSAPGSDHDDDPNSEWSGGSRTDSENADGDDDNEEAHDSLRYGSHQGPDSEGGDDGSYRSRKSSQESHRVDDSYHSGASSRAGSDDNDNEDPIAHEGSERHSSGRCSEYSQYSQQGRSEAASGHSGDDETEGEASEGSRHNESDEAGHTSDVSRGSQQMGGGSDVTDDEWRHDRQVSHTTDASQPLTDTEGDAERNDEENGDSHGSPLQVESSPSVSSTPATKPAFIDDDPEPVELSREAAGDEHSVHDGAPEYHDSRLSMDSDGEVEFRRKSHFNVAEESVSSMGEASITLEDLASPMPGAPAAAASPQSHATRSAHRPKPAQAVESHADGSGSRRSDGSRTRSDRSDADADGSQSTNGSHRDGSRYLSGDEGSYRSADDAESDHRSDNGDSQRSAYDSAGSDCDTSENGNGDGHDSRYSDYPTSDGSDADESQSDPSYESDSRHVGQDGAIYGGNAKFQVGGGTNQYSDYDTSIHVQGSTHVSSKDSYDDGSFGNSRDMLSLDSNSVHSAHHASPSGRGEELDHGSSNDGATYEFDLEKVISEPSERRRGVRRNTSFTQSFSSVNSDDSNVFGLSKLRRRGGRRTSNLRVPPLQPPAEEPALRSDLSSQLPQLEQITMEANFNDDDVSRLGESFGASQANFGESFANVDVAYRNSSGKGKMPAHEQIIEAPDAEELRSDDEESDSTYSQASKSTVRSDQSRSCGSEGEAGDQEARSYSEDEGYDGDNLDFDPEASGSNLSSGNERSVDSARSNAPPSLNDSHASSPENLELKVSQPKAESIRRATGDAACGPVNSTVASADTTAPLSEHSFSSHEGEMSVGSSSTGAAKLAMAKALEFLSSDLDNIPTTQVQPSAEAISEARSSDEADVPDASTGGDDLSRSESEGLSDDDSQSDHSNGPAKLIIREAPLLRLENVTAQTRSTIPESKLKHKSGGAGSRGWGWFALGKKGPNPAPVAAGENPQNAGLAEPKDVVPEKSAFGSANPDSAPSESAPQSLQNRANLKPDAIDPSKPNLNSFPGANSTSDGVRTDATTVAAVLDRSDQPTGAPVIPPPKNGRDELVEDVRSTSKTGGELNKESEAVSENMRLGTNVHSPSTQPHAVVQPETKVVNDESSTVPTLTDVPNSRDSKVVGKPATGSLPASSRVTAILLQASTESTVSPARGIAALSPHDSPTKSPGLSPSKRNKKKKSKESKGLTSHLERRTRKTNRHGDEVSVGTMNIQPPKPGTQFLVPTIFEEASTAVEKRPWEKALAMNKAHKMTQDPTIDVDELCIRAAVDAGVLVPLSPVRIDNSSVERQGDSDAENARGESPGERADEGNGENISDKGDSDSEDLMSLQGLQELEMKFGDVHKEVDFEDMWDTVDCDSKTALEFEDRRRGKERDKEKKRSHREKSKAAKRAKATRRLRLFEKQEDDLGYASRQSVALSNELMSALQRVFDEEAVADEADSGSDDDETFAAETTDGTLHQTGASVVSLYLNTDRSVVRGIPEVTKESDDEDDESNAEMDTSVRASKIKRKPRGKKSSKKARDTKTATRTRRPHADPAAIFDAELKRQQRFKALSVSNLRQEMSDRRGTSVRLIQKEFTERKSKRGSFSLHGQASPRQSFVGGNHQSTQNLFAGMNDASDPFAASSSPAAPSSPWRRSPRRLAGGRTPSHFDQAGKSPAQGIGSAVADSKYQHRGGLTSHMSRWEVGDHVTDLDDLLTVQMSPVRTNFFATASDMATQAASHLPSVSDLPPIPSLSVPNMPPMPNMPSMPTLPSMPNLPSLPNVPHLPNLPHLPGGVSIPSGLTPGGGNSGNGGPFGFATTFADMPLSTIDERADDENEAGLLDGRWDDDDVRPARGGGPGAGGASGSTRHVTKGGDPGRTGGGSGGGGGGGVTGRFSFKVPKPALPGGMEKGLVKLASVKRLLPKLPLRGPGDGMMNGRQMTMLDDDDRGLLG